MTYVVKSPLQEVASTHGASGEPAAPASEGEPPAVAGILDPFQLQLMVFLFSLKPISI